MTKHKIKLTVKPKNLLGSLNIPRAKTLTNRFLRESTLTLVPNAETAMTIVGPKGSS